MSLVRSAPKRIWKALARVGVATYLRRGYFTLQAAPRGYRYRARVGDAEADLAMTTWLECKRVKGLHGERAVLERLLDELDDDTVFWDIGANVGIYSCLAADAISTGAVRSFEPEVENRERLRENLARNDPDCDWAASPVALWDRDERRQLAAGFADDYREVGAGHYYLDRTGEYEVPCRRADALIDRGHPPPDVVKVDVQGAELSVLRGFGDRLDDVESLYVELHTEKATRYDATVEETERFLRDAGFSLTYLGEPSGYRTGVYHVHATR